MLITVNYLHYIIICTLRIRAVGFCDFLIRAFKRIEQTRNGWKSASTPTFCCEIDSMNWNDSFAYDREIASIRRRTGISAILYKQSGMNSYKMWKNTTTASAAPSNNIKHLTHRQISHHQLISLKLQMRLFVAYSVRLVERNLFLWF